MGREEIVSPEGLRMDGRRPHELRRIQCRTSVFTQADGSAYIEQGNTKVLATVYGPREPSKRSNLPHDKARIEVQFNVASFSSGQRKVQQRNDRRLLEVSLSIKNIFETVVSTTTAPRSEIDIYIQVLQLDGGMVHVAINAVTLALIDAGIPMTDYVCACSAGFANDTTLLDLNVREENADVPTLTLALLPKSGKVIMAGLEARMNVEHLEQVMETGLEGCKTLYSTLDECIRTQTIKAFTA